jgi:hypothetical protein
MTLKLITAVLLIAVPMYAQAQSPSAPKVNKGDAQKVVTIISGDKAKTQTFCEMKRLGGRSRRLPRSKTAKRSASCPRKFKQWKKPSVPNIWHCSTGLTTS